MAHTLKVTPVGDRELSMTRSFDGPAPLVFECWTKPQLVRRWLTGPEGWSFQVCDIDLRVGGAYRYVWRHVDGQVMGMGGVYREIVPWQRLVSNELFDEDWTGGETLCTTVFTQQGGQTLVVMTVVYSSRQARDVALQTGMEGGMAVGFDRLDSVLASLI